MTQPPEGTPWWAWVIAVALVVGIPALSGVVVAIVQRPVKRDAREAKEQATAAATSSAHAATSSAHAATELTPNHGSSAKDDIGLIGSALEAVQITLEQVQAGVEGVGKDIGGIRSELRTERTERLDVARRLDDHIRTSPRRS